jgi:hypothetical protein
MRVDDCAGVDGPALDDGLGFGDDMIEVHVCLDITDESV